MDRLMTPEAEADPGGEACRPKTWKREIFVGLTVVSVGVAGCAAWLIGHGDLAAGEAMTNLLGTLLGPVMIYGTGVMGMDWYGRQGPGRWSGLGTGYGSAWPRRGALPLDGEG